jgi:hypothetical protein
MARFLTPLRVEKKNGTWVLLDCLHYQSDAIERIIYVPRGFETDFASVPRLPLMFWLLGDRAQGAAVVHDFLYRSELVSRRLADAVFYEAARVEGVDLPSSWLFWLGVRVGGWAAYGGKHPDNKETSA